MWWKKHTQRHGKISDNHRPASAGIAPLYGAGRDTEGIQLTWLHPLGRDRRILRRNDGRHGGGGWRIRPHGVAQDAGIHQAALVSRQERGDTV